MKKTLFIVFVFILAVSLCFVACKPEPVEPAEDGFIHVSTFSQLESAIAQAKNTEKKTVILDKDLTWDSDAYPGTTSNDTVTQAHTFDLSGPSVTYKIAKAAKAFCPDVTGLTIDLNGHKIIGIPNIAFNLCGNSFTIKNGELVAADGAKFVLCINYANSTGLKDVALSRVPSAFDSSDTTGLWAKRIVIDGVTVTGAGGFISFSVVELKDSSFANPIERGLNLIGTTGTISGCTITSEQASNAALYIQNYCNLAFGAGNVTRGRVGTYFNTCSIVSIPASGSLTAQTTGNGTSSNNYSYVVDKQAKLTVNGTLKIDNTNANKPSVVDYGGMMVINNGASIVDKNGTTIAKGAEAINYITSNTGATDSGWAGYGVAGSVTDNRVLN